MIKVRPRVLVTPKESEKRDVSLHDKTLHVLIAVQRGRREEQQREKVRLDKEARRNMGDVTLLKSRQRERMPSGQHELWKAGTSGREG